MNYIIVGLAVLAGTIWLLFHALRLLTKASIVAKDATAAAGSEVAGSLSRTVLRCLRWMSSSWVEGHIPEDLDAIASQVRDHEYELKRLKRWRPRQIDFGKVERTTFEPHKPSPTRRVRTTVSVEEIGRLFTLTEPPPHKLIESLANRTCGFPGRRPKTIAAKTSWPSPVEKFTIALPAAFVRYKAGDPIRKAIARLAYRPEIEAASTATDEIERLEGQLHELETLRQSINESLTEMRAEYERELKEGLAKIEEDYRAVATAFTSACREETKRIRYLISKYETGDAKAVGSYMSLGLRMLDLPEFCSNNFEVGLDESGTALIIELELPNLPDVTLSKTVLVKPLIAKVKPVSKREAAAHLRTLHPLVLIRVAIEAARIDCRKKMEFIAVNGWVSYRERTTGKPQKGYVASLLGSTKELRDMSLPNLDPVAAFQHLSGQSAFVVDDVVPLTPKLKLDRDDSRFVEGREILGGLNGSQNLATMEWDDFEHLIRELFEVLYRKEGVEVRVTQASRDRGVDAVILDPDPLRGGKIVIQAKRYTSTVDVSAVRDLYGTVHNEGASRGILVTTSSFGPDSYQFIEGKPLTLFNGNDLLGLLKQAGKNVRIDLEEARRLGGLSS